MHDAISKTENDFCPNLTKNHRFGQKSILMKVELFEIFLSENSEIYLLFRHFAGFWHIFGIVETH
jgi:hypothetical protein